MVVHVISRQLTASIKKLAQAQNISASRAVPLPRGAEVQNELQKRPFLLPRFNKIDLSDTLRRSEELIRVTVRRTLKAFCTKTLDLTDAYNITQTFDRNDLRKKNLKFGGLTALSVEDETMWLDENSRYSIRKTGFAQLTKLIWAETFERTTHVDVEVHALFDTTDYVNVLHKTNRTQYPLLATYHLAQEQRKGCQEIHFDEECKCVSPQANFSFNQLEGRACDIINCTQIPVTVDKRWTKVASMMYWSSFFTFLLSRMTMRGREHSWNRFNGVSSMRQQHLRGGHQQSHLQHFHVSLVAFGLWQAASDLRILQLRLHDRYTKGGNREELPLQLMRVTTDTCHLWRPRRHVPNNLTIFSKGSDQEAAASS